MAARPASARAADHTPGSAATAPLPGGSSAAAARGPDPGALAHVQALPLAVRLQHWRQQRRGAAAQPQPAAAAARRRQRRAGGAAARRERFPAAKP